MSPNIEWLGHASFRIFGDKLVYIDPWQLELENPEPADIILVTHSHRDHLSLPDIEKVSNNNTIVVTIQSCAEQIEQDLEIIVVTVGDEFVVKDMPIKVVAAYNVNKFRSESQAFHPKESGFVGYLFTLDGKRIYFTGDTDPIPEMEGLDVDIVLIPVSGRAVMTAEEAAQVVADLQPELAIPMHYGSIMGSLEDAIRFKELSVVPVEILEKRTGA